MSSIERAVILTKGHERSADEVSAIADIRDSTGMSNPQIGRLFPNEGITGERVRQILAKKGERNGRKQHHELGHFAQALAKIREDERITSFTAVEHAINGFDKRGFKTFLRHTHRFREICDLFEKRRREQQKLSNIARTDRTLRELQAWAVKLGCNPAMHVLIRLDPALHARISRGVGIIECRKMAGLPEEAGAPLSPEFVQMIVGRIEFP